MTGSTDKGGVAGRAKGFLTELTEESGVFRVVALMERVVRSLHHLFLVIRLVQTNKRIVNLMAKQISPIKWTNKLVRLPNNLLPVDLLTTAFQAKQFFALRARRDKALSGPFNS